MSTSRYAGLAAALLLAVSVSACGGSGSDGGGDGGDAGDGVDCHGFPIAPPIDDELMVGTWSYTRSVLYEDGGEYDASVRGTLTIDADGGWDGSRETVTGDGSFTYPTAYGPGEWSFDSRTLELAYDDGSDTETYTGVRVSDQTSAEGAPIRALQLESADETGCLVTLLQAPR